MTEAEQREFFMALDREGETQVRIRLAQGDWGVRGDRFAAALEWIRLKDEERNESRHSSTVRRARRAEIIAIIAAIIAAASMIKDIIIAIFK